MQILRQTRCIVSETASYIHAFCSLILKESRTNEYLNYPQHDIFLEQGNSGAAASMIYIMTYLEYVRISKVFLEYI